MQVGRLRNRQNSRHARSFLCAISQSVLLVVNRVRANCRNSSQKFSPTVFRFTELVRIWADNRVRCNREDQPDVHRIQSGCIKSSIRKNRVRPAFAAPVPSGLRRAGNHLSGSPFLNFPLRCRVHLARRRQIGGAIPPAGRNANCRLLRTDGLRAGGLPVLVTVAPLP